MKICDRAGPGACRDRPWAGGGGRRRGRSWEVSPGIRVHPFLRHEGLAGAGERLGVLRQGHTLFAAHRPAEALRPCGGHGRPVTIRAKVTGQVLNLDETLQETIPALLWLLDALPDDSPFRRLDPPQRRQRLLDALKRLLLLSVRGYLHWTDAETQTLLDRLVDSLPTARLLLFVNYRPEYQHGWGSKTYYTQLRLDPLPPTSADAVLDALLGDGVGTQHAAPLQALKQLLIARTEGNPFFLEESVRALVETGVLVGEPGAYRLVQPVDACRCPPPCRQC